MESASPGDQGGAGAAPARSEPNLVARVSPALFAAGCVLTALLTFRDYGINWDDYVQLTYAQDVVAYFATFGANQHALVHDTRFYGPLFELCALGLGHVLALDPYVARHLATAVAGLLALYAVYRIARLLGLGELSLFAPIALALMPRFYGQSFVNSKDLPFATAVGVCMWAGFLHIAARGRLRNTLLLGLALGAALAIRPGGLPILALFVAIPHLVAMWRGHLERRSVLRAVPVVMVVAFVVMIAPWPFALQAPSINPVLAILSASSFPMVYPVLFEGHVIQSAALPGRYLLEFLLITVPIPFLALGALGCYVALRDGRRASAMQAPVLIALPCWFALPFVLALCLRPNVYDGMRHVLFTLPALAILAAVGGRELCALASRGRSPWLGYGLLALCCVSPVSSMIRLHPYETTYFNAFVGGVGGASGRYETEYFLLAYREAAEWINAHAHSQEHPIRVLVAADDHGFMAARHFLAREMQMDTTFHHVQGSLPAQYDYYIGTSRYGFDQSYPGSKVAYTVGREGAVFAVVRSRQ